MDLKVPPIEIVVRPDDLSSSQVQSLVSDHIAGMQNDSPAGHVHALALDALKSADVTFWSAWVGDQLCGCGALKSLSASSGEVKSMRTRQPFQRQGVGQAILNEIILTARHRGYTHLFLETGTGEPFAAAHAFYLRNGFTWCDPFADYVSTDFNVFMTKLLSRTDA